ncbi:MAG: glycosyltransferase family 2 protein [Pseudomonadota bacterium]
MERYKYVCAIVVTYQPDLGILQQLLTRLKDQAVVIVDNTESDTVKGWFEQAWQHCQHFAFLHSGTNLGVAAGHNRGICWAKERHFEYVVLFDQDSLPATDMISLLLAAYIDLESKGENVSLVGPKYVDSRINQAASFIKFKGCWMRRLNCSGAIEYHPVEYLITSGSLIKISVFDTVGQFDASLFIDYVDVEWGLRANSYGFRSFGVCNAVLMHCMGDVMVKHPLAKASLPVHSPLRNYYMFRNAVLLYRKSFIPLCWKLNDGWRLILRFVFYAVYTTPRWHRIHMMGRGLWHGIRGRRGQYH